MKIKGDDSLLKYEEARLSHHGTSTPSPLAYKEDSVTSGTPKTPRTGKAICRSLNKRNESQEINRAHIGLCNISVGVII